MIEPALTPEQWVGERRPGEYRDGSTTVPAPTAVYFRRPRQYDEGHGVEVHYNGAMWYFDGSSAVDISNDTRHALAALCLNGQPFGFTWEDVDLLRDLEWSGAGGSCPLCHSLDYRGHSPECRGDNDLADRLAALLPPR